MSQQLSPRGFTTPELLITLFVGAVFLIGGYQIWIQVIQAGTDTGRAAVASTSAYDYLRQYSASNGSSCTATSNLYSGTPTASELENPTVVVSVSCPFSGVPELASLSKVTAKVTYGPTEKRETVSHAIYN